MTAAAPSVIGASPSSLFTAICYRGGEGERGKVEREGAGREGLWGGQGENSPLGAHALKSVYEKLRADPTHLHMRLQISFWWLSAFWKGNEVSVPVRSGSRPGIGQHVTSEPTVIGLSSSAGEGQRSGHQWKPE